MIENILEIKIGDELYGFDADKIEQILEIPAITPVPLSDGSMLGIVVLSGKISQVLDLGRLIGSSEIDIKNDKARLLTLSNNEKDESFVIDEVLGILAVDENSFEENSDKNSFLMGFYKTDNEVVQVLDIEKLLTLISLDTFTPTKLDSLQNSDEDENNRETTEDFKRVLFFKAEDERFAIDIESLRELIFVPDEITPIAGSDALGMITLRDEVITLLDMNSLLGFSYKVPDEKSRALIAHFDGKSVALLVNEVEEVKTIKNLDLEPMPENMSNDMIEYIYKEDNGIASIISNAFIRNLTREYHLEEENKQIENSISEGDVSEIAVFKIGSEEYAFDIEEVQEIIRYDEITPVPQAPEFIEGILNLRGAVISIVSLPERLGFEKNITDKTKIIVCAIKNEKIGFIVDDVNEILFVEDEFVSKSNSEESLFDEIINLDEGKRVILKIKVENLLDDETLEQIQMMEK